MIIEKKFLTSEYIATLCIGLFRYDIDTIKDGSLININTCMNYFFTTKTNIYNSLFAIYDTENQIYLKIFSLIIEEKILNINTDSINIKQNIINKLENTIDNNLFIKVQKFLDYIDSNFKSNKFNNSLINLEFDKIVKYLTISNSMNSLKQLYQNFYNTDKYDLEYETSMTGLFHTYESSLNSSDFILGEDEDDIEAALLKTVEVQQECRSVPLLDSIRFIEKRRIAIFVAASGAGKSMMLCHSTAEFLMKKKQNDKTKIVFYFTFENTKEETLHRIISNITDIDINQLKYDLLDENKRKNIIKLYLQKKDKNTKLVISEFPPMRYNMMTIEACIDKALLKFKNSEVYAVMLDYVDKMLPVDNRKTLKTDEMLGYVVDDFKALCKKYDTPGLTVSQFNRTGVQKARSKDEMATGTDIGGSWKKVENADIVILMQVNDTFEDIGYNTVLLSVYKHRYYRSGSVITCTYKPNFAKFYPSDYSSGGMMKGRFDDSEQKSRKDLDSMSIY
jgi:hypothetical protein